MGASVVDLTLPKTEVLLNENNGEWKGHANKKKKNPDFDYKRIDHHFLFIVRYFYVTEIELN